MSILTRILGLGSKADVVWHLQAIRDWCSKFTRLLEASKYSIFLRVIPFDIINLKLNPVFSDLFI